MSIILFSKSVARSIWRPQSAPPWQHASMRPSHRKLLWLLLVILLPCLSAANAANNAPLNSDPQMKKPTELPVRYSGILYKSGNRRDPFINPLLYKKKNRVSDDEEISRGVPPPGIAGTYIAQATLQGLAIREHQRVAVFRAADSRAYFLKKGDRLFDGYVKEIHDDSVVLVRETKMRSGKTLTQDVIKRLRTP